MTRLPLTDRAILSVAGPDARTVLQGVLTQDMDKAVPGRALYGALLTPQGKFIVDMFILSPEEGVFWLDVPARRRADLKRRLTLYRLRAKADIAERDDLSVWAAPDAPAPQGEARADGAGGLVYGDPRLPALGARGVAAAPAPPPDAAAADAYAARRLALGVPDPESDLVAEGDFLLEGLFDELCGVDFHKGCYVGQEMTSRMKRRATVRSKLTPIVFDGPPPPPDTPILAGDWAVGSVRTGREGRAMALVRLDRALAASAPLTADGRPVRLDPPAWLILPGSG